MANAARTITYQVSSAIMQFVSYSNMSFQPQSIMSYSEGKFSRFFNLQCLGAKVNVGIFSLIGTPIILFTPTVLNIWLGEVPIYTVGFIHALLAYQAIRCFHSPIDTLFKAEGSLRNYQICELCIMVLNLPVSWTILKWGAPYWSVFIVMMVIEIINLIAILTLSKRMLNFPVKTFVHRVIGRSSVIFIIIMVLGIIVEKLKFDSLSFFEFVGGTIAAVGIIGFTIFFVLFNKNERGNLCAMLPILRKIQK